MRSNATPLSVAEPHPWRSSAPSLRWAKPAIRGLDWELWPGARGQLTAPPTYRIDALAYKKGRGRQDRPWAPCFLRSKKGKQVRGAERVTIGRSHNLGTSKEFWSIRPGGKSTKNWNRTLLGNDRRCDSRLQFEWIACGLTGCVSGPRRGVGSRRWKAWWS
jgi:hypothetical protein